MADRLPLTTAKIRTEKIYEVLPFGAWCAICGLGTCCCTLPIYATVDGQETINRTRENLQKHQEEVWKKKEASQ